MMAQETQPSASPNEFVPVTGGQDTTSAELLLVAAYAVMWVIVFAFVFLSFRRALGLERRLTELEDRLKPGAGESAE